MGKGDLIRRTGLPRLAKTVRSRPALLLRLLPFLIVLLLSGLSLVTLGNYLYSDTIADLTETSFHEGDHDPFVNRPPLPQLLLEGLGALFPAEKRLPAFSVLQHGFILVEVLLIGLFFKDRRQPILSLLVPLIWALMGRNYVLAHTTRTEPLFLVLSMLWLWLANRWLERSEGAQGWIWAGLAALATGVLPACRTIGVIAFGLVCLAWWLSPRHHGWRSAGQLALVVLGAVGVMLSFKALNQERLGRFTLVDETGLHFLHRVVAHEKELPDAPASKRIVEIAAELDLPLFEKESVWEIRNGAHFGPRKMPSMEIDQLMGQAAKEAFLDRPFHFAWTTVKHIFVATGRADVELNVPVGLDPGAYKWNALHWQTINPYVTELCGNFPTREVDAAFGGAGYAVLLELSNRGVSLLVRGWWVPIALFVLGILCLVLRDPGFVLATGLASGILIVSCITEAAQPRFWESGELPFLLALAIGGRWFYDRMRGWV